MKGKPSQHKGRWVTLKERNQKEFRAKGKEVKRFNVCKMMADAAKRGKQK